MNQWRFVFRIFFCVRWAKEVEKMKKFSETNVQQKNKWRRIAYSQDTCKASELERNFVKLKLLEDWLSVSGKGKRKQIRIMIMRKMMTFNEMKRVTLSNKFMAHFWIQRFIGRKKWTVKMKEWNHKNEFERPSSCINSNRAIVEKRRTMEQNHCKYSWSKKKTSGRCVRGLSFCQKSEGMNLRKIPRKTQAASLPRTQNEFGIAFAFLPHRNWRQQTNWFLCSLRTFESVATRRDVILRRACENPKASLSKQAGFSMLSLWKLTGKSQSACAVRERWKWPETSKTAGTADARALSLVMKFRVWSTFRNFSEVFAAKLVETWLFFCFHLMLSMNTNQSFCLSNC